MLPAGVDVVAEKDAVFSIAIVVEEGAADCRATQVVEGGYIELEDWLVFYAGDLAIEVAASPDFIADVGVSVEVWAEVVGQGKHLRQQGGRAVGSRKATVREGEDGFRASKLVAHGQPRFFRVGVVVGRVGHVFVEAEPESVFGGVVGEEEHRKLGELFGEPEILLALY